MSHDDQDPCHCLLCHDPPDESRWDERDHRIAGNVREHGWHVMGVTPADTPDWAYSIGLWHTLRSPEVCVFGLPTQTAMTIINLVGNQIRDGQALHQDERRPDVLTDFDVTFRPVHPSWYRSFFGAGITFYPTPPMPMVQLFWPDKTARLPWDEDAEQYCRDSQPSLWLPRSEHPNGQWTHVDPRAGWPFPDTLPYQTVRVSQPVLDGTTAITLVRRDDDGTWHFLGNDTNAELVEAPLGRITNEHPEILQLADLRPGQHAVRDNGQWRHGNDS